MNNLWRNPFDTLKNAAVVESSRLYELNMMTTIIVSPDVRGFNDFSIWPFSNGHIRSNILEDNEIKNHIDLLIAWTKTDFEEFTHDTTNNYDDWYDTEKAVLSVEEAFDLMYRMRHGMKGLFWIYGNEIQKILEKQTTVDPLLENADEFDTMDGYPYYYVLNDDVSVVPFLDNTRDFWEITIDVPKEITTKLLQTTERADIFRIILWKDIIYDEKLKHHNEFVIYAENGNIMSSIIACNSTYHTDTCYFYYTANLNAPLTYGAAFDSRLRLDLRSLYNNGDYV